MKNSKIIVKTADRSYPVYFGNEIINSTGSLIQKKIPNARKIFLIVDKKLPLTLIKKLKVSLKKYELIICKLHVTEKIKSYKMAFKLIEDLLKYNFKRSDCVISMGGGILGDLSAFVSNLTKRGIKFINIPTTLLSQSDAAIGGKTAVNSVKGKNLIGTFYQPEFVLVDLATLNTLPYREMICGYGEILKHSLIQDRSFFFWLSKNAKKIINKKEKNIIKTAIIRSCLIKSKIINKDEKEKNLRMILNFGHTFAHGFEGATNFSKKLNHGEAVLMGMMVASELAYKKKILSLNELNLIKTHYLNLSLPMKINKLFKKSEINKILYFMKKDKKNFNNKINLILINKIGSATKPNKFNISFNEIRKFLLSFFIN